MSKKLLGLTLAFAALAATAESRGFLDMHNQKPNSKPEWKRKKCKSCTGFHKYSSCSSNPKQQACSSYNKRKR